MTKAQQTALETIKAAGGAVVRFKHVWDDNVKLNLTAVKSLCRAGLLTRSKLAPRAPTGIVPEEYRLIER
jgi:hypothetical protein